MAGKSEIKSIQGCVTMKLSKEQIEAYAKELHEHYIKAQTKHPYKWSELPNEIKESNRAQVREFPSLLEQFGADDIEALARGVHECWMQNCSNTNDSRMVDYSKLSESEKQKDRVIVNKLLLLVEHICRI